MSDLTGQTIAGYPLQKVLYTGSYFEAYEALTQAAPLTFLLLREDLRTGGTLMTNILKGWERARAVNHPNLATVYSTGNDLRLGPYCLQESILGKDLRQSLLGGAKVAWRDLLVIAEQMFSALAALHAESILHGEIWPGNMFLTQDQDLKLISGGALPQLEAWPTRVMRGPAVGYLAPELISGSPFTEATDIYSAGAALYFVATTQDPHPGNDVTALTESVLERKVPSITIVRGDLPPETEVFICRLMAKDPVHRYANVNDVRADIARLQAGQSMASFKGGVPAKAAQATQSQSAPPPPAPELPAGMSSGKATAIDVKGGPPVPPRSGMRVFGGLDTHVKSTIPHSEKEKRGDDLFRQHQLPLALNAWKDAYNVSPHAALKVKIELGEKDFQRESYKVAMDEARYRMAERDYIGALNNARDGLVVSETESQRNEALILESDAIAGLRLAARSRMNKLLIGGAIFLIAIALAFKFTGKAPEPEAPPAGAGRETAEPKTAEPTPIEKREALVRVPIAGTTATLVLPPPWVKRGGDFAAMTAQGKDPAATLRIAPSPLPLQPKLQELRNPAGLKNAVRIDDHENIYAIDGVHAVYELGYRHTTDDGGSGYRYFYLVVGPDDKLYVAQFDGAEKTFTQDLRDQMRTLLHSWSWQK